MWSYMILFCVTTASFADGVVEVEVVVTETPGQMRCNGRSANLLVDELFQIFVNYSGTKVFHRLRCSARDFFTNFETQIFFKEDPKSGRQGYVSKTMKMDQAGKWTYSCEFYSKPCFNENQNFCYFYYENHRYVDKGIKCSVDIQVLKPEEITRNLTGRLVSNNVNKFPSPGIFTYNFPEGEGVVWGCHKTSGGAVKLLYTDTDGTEISTDYRPDSVYMYFKLTAANNNNTKLKCIITDERHQNESVIDMLLLASTTRRSIIGFEVNGLDLPFLKNNNTDYYYYYTYYSGEPLQLMPLKDNRKHGYINCDVIGENPPYNLTQTFKNSIGTLEWPIFTVLYEGNSGTDITCTVCFIHDVSHCEHMKITFIHQTKDYSPFIGGLSRAHILMQYANAYYNVLYYEDNPDEPLYLSCTTADNASTKWLYDNRTIISPGGNLYIKKRLFKLRPQSATGKIECQISDLDSDKNTLLVLKRMSTVETTSPPPTEVTQGPTQKSTIENGADAEGEINTDMKKGEDKSNEKHGEAVEKSKGNVDLPTTNTKAKESSEGEIQRTARMNNSTKVIPTTVKPLSQSTKSNGATTKKITRISTKPRKSTTNKPQARRKHQQTTKNKPTTRKATESTTRKITTDRLEVPKIYLTNEVSKNTDKGKTFANTSEANSAEVNLRSKDDNNTEEKSVPEHFGIIIAAAVLLLVVVAVIIWIIAELRKRKRTIRNNPTDFDYQNLPQHNEGVMPTPPQWDERANELIYANTNNEDLYSKPVPKSKRNTKTEPTYSEACDVIECTYASVENGLKYASIQNINAPSATVLKPNTPYTTVQTSDSAYATVQKPDSPYATVQKPDAPYATVQKPDAPYATVQKPAPSASIQDNQDATYAEIGKTEYQNLSALRIAPQNDSVSAKSYKKHANKNIPVNYANLEDLKRNDKSGS